MTNRAIGVMLIIAILLRVVGMMLVPTTHAPLQALVSLLCLLGWNVLLFGSVICAMVHAAQRKQWIWFGSLFLILPVFAYAVFGPADRKVPAPVAPGQ